MARKTKLERFNEHVLSKFEIYNSLFLTLPFKSILKTSLLLPLFSEHCKSGYNEKKSPLFIVESFFDKYCVELTDKEKLNLMFSFIQFIERQIVLFDAIEDSAFSIVNNMHGRGTLRYIKEETIVMPRTNLFKLQKEKSRLLIFPGIKSHIIRFLEISS